MTAVWPLKLATDLGPLKATSMRHLHQRLRGPTTCHSFWTAITDVGLKHEEATSPAVRSVS